MHAITDQPFRQRFEESETVNHMTSDFGMDMNDVWKVMWMSSIDSLAEQSGDPDLAVEPGRDARPAVVGGRPVRAGGVPLVALEDDSS